MPEQVRSVDIVEEAQRAYLDYAMSVIVARALPDARDGLKPVQRRILYAMYDMGLRPDTPYKKSARIVGEVLGKYHPHGDSAVYEAMARMAQDFSLRYPLVDGQGNFGSVDGDPPAAMRYTEARLAPLAMEMLADIEKETVDWVDNFDGSLKEPTVLPARLPLLLLNGASGIAVGMSTNIPPHNLAEVVDALVFLLDNWRRREKVGVEELMRFIPGPDFPTGGLLYRRTAEDGDDGLLRAYANGRGQVIVRARVHTEMMRGGRRRLVVTELPYQVNKAQLVGTIAELVRSGKLEGIADLRDESDRQGMRLVIDLARNADADAVFAALCKHTALESRYSLILLALVDGQPRHLSLRKALLLFLDHRLTLLQRRSRYELRQARHREHIVAGLLVALDNLDEVIATIRRSRTTETARRNLQRKFSLTEVQAQAILDMPLKRLAALERRKLKDEHAALLHTIRGLESLLKTPRKQRAAIRADLLDLKARYGDARRTHIADRRSERASLEDLIPDETVIVGVTRTGRIGRITPPDKSLRLPSRPAEAPLFIAEGSTRMRLYLFTEGGEAAALPVHQVPGGAAWAGEGTSWAQVLPRARGAVAAALLLAPDEEGMLLFLTSGGMVKRMEQALLPPVGQGMRRVIRLERGEKLTAVLRCGAEDEAVVASSGGLGIRFAVADVRPTGTTAGGVAGIRLAAGERAVAAALVARRARLAVFDSAARGKRLDFARIPLQRRGGKGVILMRPPEGAALTALATVGSKARLLLVSAKGATKHLTAASLPEAGRAASGKPMMALRKRDRLASVLLLP